MLSFPNRWEAASFVTAVHPSCVAARIEQSLSIVLVSLTSNQEVSHRKSLALARLLGQKMSKRRVVVGDCCPAVTRKSIVDLDIRILHDLTSLGNFLTTEKIPHHGPTPLNGTCTMPMPARRLYNSAAM